ncbi:2-succinyl-5-enolpyruvyl-6-hydroxy-3-cyclohexene-1-carboxylic-acid synthase [[Phormidium] sp. ETS-05]|uniref:2-succinyl-5-enolpyruvyl-6-hydroxy-3- cyclohexene-1-carboxylic-acid synthase n=1 Tax=[Phormidium] sp. ETS-05 TaxID=222819 RepID=UPI0018EEF82A|nr:2-succinyl-5-enolpyruvyl-6-hydroxy-3-cyclohexene-1-carboxylic-acid synthase [[Phormidium] sp. ETS-05]
MPIDFSNTNTVWASIIVETLHKLGLTTAVICPGSRSTPLAFAFAAASLEAIPVLDERAAAFFALGIARQTGKPVALVCTSGTAGANFFPAVIEARESGVPLIILTADRPPELRDCRAGQAIDQVKLYGNYPNWQAELAIPALEMPMLQYLRQMTIHAWERCLYPVRGPVHLNCPFRDPLVPIPEPAAMSLAAEFDKEGFFDMVQPSPPSPPLPKRERGEKDAHNTPSPHLGGGAGGEGTIRVRGEEYLYNRDTPHSGVLEFMASDTHIVPWQLWQQCERGIIIAGPAQPQSPMEYVISIDRLSQILGWPVLAEGLSPLRNYASFNPYLISTYDLILRNPELAAQSLPQSLAPEMVIQIGDLPTSKQLREWLAATAPRRWVLDPNPHNFDPLHGATVHLRLGVTQLSFPDGMVAAANSSYLQLWCAAETAVGAKRDRLMSTITEIIEPKAAWVLSQVLPPETPLFIANSMPVRDVEYFWSPNNSHIRPFFNRGANGIDGTLSTAFGIAHRQPPSVMLTGDLALLHDTNGFLISRQFRGSLTIVLINNNGGGIFEMLPVAKFDPPFEEFFATPQNIDFARLGATYGVKHHLITSWQQLIGMLNPLPEIGVRILELQTNRKIDSNWRRETLRYLAAIG